MFEAIDTFMSRKKRCLEMIFCKPLVFLEIIYAMEATSD